MKTLDGLDARYDAVRDRISEAAIRSGRRPQDVILIAVTKQAEPEQIRRLIERGHQDFGENKVQQLVQRAAMVDEYLARLRVLPETRRHEGLMDPVDDARPIRWHMIGHLQRNKARKAIEFARLIHSVDSLRLAEELQQVALKRDLTIDVLVQVNCSNEESKFGCPVPAARPLAEQIDTMVGLRLRGLMTMAAPTEDSTEARPTFERAREIFEDLGRRGLGDGRCNLLSMGMSNDYEIAIEAGANLVRVGSAIFQGEDHDDDDDLDVES